MKKILLSLAIALIATSLSAQWNGGGGGGKWQKKGPSIKGKVSGKLIDESTGSPVEFATAVILDPESGKEMDGGVTNEKGQFKLLVDVGTYKLHLSFLGYETKIIENIELTAKKPDANLGDIKLVPESMNLDEVTVSAEASIVENRIDKMVYNAEKDPTNAIGDGSDVMRKVPMLVVDIEGNVSLRGSSNIRILINGKPSTMFANNVGDALKSLPGDQIKSVEVITTPSAKYDGEGSAGIVNIITKKKDIQGFTGRVSGSAGNRSNNFGLNLSAAKGRFGLNGGGYSYYSVPIEGGVEFDRSDVFEGRNRVYTQDGPVVSDRLGFNFNFGAFYDINAYNAINSSFRINGYTSSRDGETDALMRFLDTGEIIEQTKRETINDVVNYGFDWTTDYTKKFAGQEKRELSFAFQLSGSINDQTGSLLQTGNIFIDETNNNDGTNLESTFQVDYTHPINDKLDLEIGAKAVLRDLESNYRFDTLGLGDTERIRDFERSDLFNYTQNVLAGYASINWRFTKSLGAVIGARFENTDISGEYDSELPQFENSYNNLLPSIIISKTFKNFSSLKLSYTERIQRPSLFFINPFTNQLDRRSLSTGNPELDPETARQVELNYGAYIKGVVINASVYYKNTQDMIEGINQGVNSDGISLTVFDNVGTNNSIGMNLFTSFTIKKIWQLRGNFNVFTYNAESTKPELINFSNDGYVYNIFMSSTISLKDDWKLEFFGLFNSSTRTLQGTNPTFSMYSFGFSKELFKKRASLGFRAVTPFHKYRKFDTEINGENFSQTSQFRLPFRSFGLSFSYRFGKLDFKASTRKSKIRNDDVKSGGDSNQGQGGGGGGGNRGK